MMTKDYTRGIPSRASVFKHPVHPMLIPFPIAFLVGTLLTDLAYLWRNDPFWARASLWLVGAGLVGGGLAAIFGFTDFLLIEKVRQHRIAWIHFFGNVVVVILAAISLIVRLFDPAGAVMPLGLLLSVLITGMLLVTGWLGGDLSYRHMVGVDGHNENERHS